MGEVYRARDLKLRRDVALKILPDPFAADADRVARFRREAQLLASLNHPNIAIIHGLEESDIPAGSGPASVRALVLELVEGPTLAERLSRTGQVGRASQLGKAGLPLDEALAIARQIVDALDVAHEQGIVHRDLKPANVKVRSDGAVKVLDFGLAKLAESVQAGHEAGPSELTLPAPMVNGPEMTQAGVILGTAAYMSPEQAMGRAVDKRADTWAFGCVLYEMLTGRRPFEGDDVSAVLARVIERDPDWTALPARTPPSVIRLLRRCLEKDPRRRLRDIGDARADLEGDLAPATETIAAPRRAKRWTVVAAIALAAAAALGIGWWMGSTRSRAPASPVSRLTIDVSPAEFLLGSHPLEQTPFGRSRPSRTAIALSPDGRTIAFTAHRDGTQSLYVRPFDQDQARPLPGTEGADEPFFSTDGAWVGFWSGGSLKKVAIAGGPPVRLVVSPLPMGASWAEDDRIVFERGTTIWSVPASGGPPAELTKRLADGTEARHVSPQVLPGGRWLLYTVLPVEFGWDQARVVAQSLETGERKILIEGAADARYVPTGHLVYMRLGNLMAAPLSLRHISLAGGEIGVVEGVMQSVNTSAIPIDTGAGQYAFSSDGTLAFVAGDLHPDFEGALLWVLRDGSIEPIPVPPPSRPYFAPKLSPDGRSLAVGTLSLHDQSLWRYDLSDRTLTRLTTAGRVEHPAWSHDGARIAIGLSEKGTYNLFAVASDGSGRPERLIDSQTFQLPAAWTPDDRSLVFWESSGDVSLLSLDTPRQVRPLLNTPFGERMADLSPDGRWLAYVSNETGQSEVYVQSFPGLGGKRRISTEGGIEPAWSRNGRKLVFLSPRAPATGQGFRLVEVDVTLGERFSAAPPTTLFELPWYTPAIGARAYDLNADASRFVFVRETHPPAVSLPREIHIVQNWFEELRRRAPVGGK